MRCKGGCPLKNNRRSRLLNIGGLQRAAGVFNRQLSLAAGLFQRPVAVKADDVPETSPLVALYSNWEGWVRAALLDHWLQQTGSLTGELEGMSGDLSDILNDDDYWDNWQGEYLTIMIPLLEEAGGMGADIASANLLDEYALGVNLDRVTLAVSDWARQYASDLAYGLTSTDQDLLRRNLSAWVEASEDFPALVKRINSFLNNERRARTIATTEGTRAYAEGNLVVWRESDVVTGQVWNTAADELVCPICKPLNGQIAELDGQTWQHRNRPNLDVGLSVAAPPAHPNCRCWLAPWVGELPRKFYKMRQNWEAV